MVYKKNSEEVWLEIFKKHNNGYKIYGTRFHYYLYGRSTVNAVQNSYFKERWWRRGDDRVLRPVSIDQVLQELPEDKQDAIIWNIGKIKE